MVRAKVYCTQVRFSHEDQQDPEGNELPLTFHTVTLQPVNRCMGPRTDEEDEDSIYGRYTPSGEITLTMKAEAALRFQVGAKYYVDFKPVTGTD